MSRLHYYAALLFSAACAAVLLGGGRAHGSLPAIPGSPEAWFYAVKPYCNSLEAELVLGGNPPPPGVRGTGFAAACLALAGRIDEARARILALPQADRYQAAGVVFEVGHPVADAGDDRSAGPIMGLVVEFWPNHYMALYHAGMAHWAVGSPEPARGYLTRFLAEYKVDRFKPDGWVSNARRVLERIDSP